MPFSIYLQKACLLNIGMNLVLSGGYISFFIKPRMHDRRACPSQPRSLIPGLEIPLISCVAADVRETGCKTGKHKESYQPHNHNNTLEVIA